MWTPSYGVDRIPGKTTQRLISVLTFFLCSNFFLLQETRRSIFKTTQTRNRGVAVVGSAAELFSHYLQGQEVVWSPHGPLCPTDPSCHSFLQVPVCFFETCGSGLEVGGKNRHFSGYPLPILDTHSFVPPPGKSRQRRC